MHPLDMMSQEIESTHSGLGNALAIAIITTKARLCLLLVSPSGCGKSVVTGTIAKQHPESLSLLSITKARLGDYKDKFTNFRGVVVMDDMAAAGGTYERKETLVAFSALCYSHTISKHTWTADYEISDFHGAAILNVQPSLLAEIYEFPEWESLIQDRTMRYYHLYRATKPNSKQPEVDIDWGGDIEKVHQPRHDFKLYGQLADIAAVQWGDTRINEHLDMLLKAVAALDYRVDVIHSDLQLLLRLMRPMTIERAIMSKSGFETGRRMDKNLAAVLVEFASWTDVNVARISRDYKIHPSIVYRILASIPDWFKEDRTKAKLLQPTPELRRVLKEAGVRR